MKLLKSLLTTATLYIYMCVAAFAQTTSTPQTPTTLEGWADHVARFGNAIPQEKVFLHLDNTCYFLGDTIWFKAYTRRTDKAVPSNVSRVLYAELYNQDGYLVERQIIQMNNGQGHGNFALPDTLYGGFYELRAYTRWQLNWGLTQHPHTKYAEQWFFNRAMAREYYRDYEKLYSRVFPVYSKPKNPGEYSHDMTVRPLRRTYKEEDKSALRLGCYPEGGHLVGGAPCRLVFEATTEEGEWQEGQLQILKDGQPMTLTDEQGRKVTSVPAVNRGRGSCHFTPEAGKAYTALFTAANGKTAKSEVKNVAADGVALTLTRNEGGFAVEVQPQGIAADKQLGLTVQHEGRVLHFEALQSGDAQAQGGHAQQQSGHTSLQLDAAELQPGVNQITVFDAEGRVWADRLFFVTTPQLLQPSLTISGLKPEYAPFEQATLNIQRPAISSQGSTSLSIAVRDASTQDYLYDSGNILTEMLLASEIRGFIPQPEYFFEADDEEHRTALDLLMLTQGWRRFEWKTMATPGAFTLNHLAEYTPVLTGIVHPYMATRKENEIADKDLADHTSFMEGEDAETLDQKWNREEEEREASQGEVNNDDAFQQLVESVKSYKTREGQFSTTGMANSRFLADEGRLKREILVHAEFVQPGEKNGIVGDAVTEKGRFRMQIPDFEGYCLLFLGASDTTKWKIPGKHLWIDMNEEDYPEFYVRLSFPYPRFVKPYNFYHTRYPAPPAGSVQTLDFVPEDGTVMNTVTVRGRHRGLRAFDASKPAFVIDAYEAFNQAADAGLSIAWFQGHSRFINDVARTFIGDMNMERAYNIELRLNSKNSTFYHSTGIIEAYNRLENLDKVYVYTDYSPRREGSTAFDQDNQPTVTIDLRRPEDEGRRVTYRDRYYALQGFNVADDFYSPDYSQHPLPDGQQDYRRTLYWNPDLQLDADGHAQISFFTGSKPTILNIEANGQSPDGALLTN